MKNRLFPLIVLLALCAFAKHDGEYVTTMRGKVVTPHYVFSNDSTPLKVLFILNRQGARDAVELAERIPIEAEYFIAYDREHISSDSIYEAALSGTTFAERRNELSRLLEKDYDVYVIGRLNFKALPEEAKYNILKKVELGAGLVTARMPVRLPYSRVYATPLQKPEFVENFAKVDDVNSINAFQLGKGRVVEIVNKFSNSNANALTSHMDYSNRWYAKYENAMAQLGASMRFAAGLETVPDGGSVRVRDVWNNDVTGKKLPGGTYFKDELGANGAFRVTEMQVMPNYGIAALYVPEDVRGKVVSGTVTLAKPVNGKLKIELIDSPTRRTWVCETKDVSVDRSEYSFSIGKGGLSTLAGYVRVTLLVDDAADDIRDSVVFFPSNSIDDYLLMAWDGADAAPGDLLYDKQVEELGWNYVLTHPGSNYGSNLRALALLNQKKVLYTTRIMLNKNKDGNLNVGLFLWLDREQRKRLDAIKGEHTFYDPRIQELWSEMIINRIEDYSKYSIALYSLGDENDFGYNIGYGESNLPYFRRFLKVRYGNVEKLNENWNTNFASFAEVPHLTMEQARNEKNFSAWGDHIAYMEKMYADMHKFSSKVIKGVDAEAKVGAEGSVPGDLELSMDGLEFWGPYANAVGDELLRSLAHDRVRTIWWGGYPGTHGGRAQYPHPLLKDLVRGCVNGSAWFACMPGSNHSSFTCDLDYAQYVKNYIPEMNRMRRGAAHELIANPLYMQDKILIYWSHLSSKACQLDMRCPNPEDSIVAIIKDLYRKGLGFQFVSKNCLERLQNADLLFLCGATALSDEECNAIMKFASNGGTLVIDANPAIMNEYLAPRKNSPLEMAIGIMNWDCAQAGHNENRNGAQVLVYGNAVEKQFGKGIVKLLGHTLGSYSATSKEFGTAFMKNVFASGRGIKPEYTIENGTDNMLFRIRDCGDHRIIGAWVPESDMGHEMTVKLPSNSFIYKLDGGFIGHSDNLPLSFKQTPLELFSCFDTEQTPPSFSIGDVAFASPAKIVLPPLKRGRYYRLEIFTPDGTLRGMHVFDRKETAPAINVALEDATGNWMAILTDVATGLSTKTSFRNITKLAQ